MQPVLLLSHGASVFSSDPTNSLYQHLKELGSNLLAQPPKAVLMVSAHFVQQRWTLTSSANPAIIHDHPVVDLRNWRYPVLGEPALAAHIAEVLQASGLEAATDGWRGLDHGAWLALAPMFGAELQIPVIQLSLRSDLSPTSHLQAGRSIAHLREEGVLIVTSGGMTHNQQEFRQGYEAREYLESASPKSRRFDAWLHEQLTHFTGSARSDALSAFTDHVDADWAHPSPEHLLPIFVGLGAAENCNAINLWSGFQLGLSTAAYRLD